MFTFLLIIQSLVAALMVAVILMQKSEGGGLGVGGSPSGLMSARGAADFLTRATAILATAFVVLSIVLAALAAVERPAVSVDPSVLKQQQAPGRTAPPVIPAGPAGQAPATNPLAVPGATPPATQPANGSVPLAQ
ncbi:MAG TPA: preprotein translocase subunit SecG [Allosphingosinicella sp.]|nr:preprotein translocase subunit SecG [Allosphingosinicella sp.]